MAAHHDPARDDWLAIRACAIEVRLPVTLATVIGCPPGYAR